MLAFVDQGSGELEPRFIQVGRMFVDLTDPNQERYYQIIGGLQEGERIVSSANFLIDAEAQVQGAVKDFGAESPGGGGETGRRIPAGRRGRGYRGWQATAWRVWYMDK